jgi:hypothetical protein
MSSKSRIKALAGEKNEKKRLGNLKNETPTHFAEKIFCLIIGLSGKSHD